MNIFRLPPALAAVLVAFLQCLPASNAQYPPSSTFQTILTSRLNPKISVAYKQPPAGTCMTAYTTQKQYTGYISIPPYTLEPIQQNYSINTFFWFIEARQTPETAPLTIWLNGGPGSSSMVGLFNEVGPCEVVQMGDGDYGTQSRQWGWDRSTNILFIDQPNQVGFSYDTATNASYDLFQGRLFEPPTTQSDTKLPPFLFTNGTFGTASENSSGTHINTANTTEVAARSVWHFLQTWLSTFPQYNPAVRPNVTLNSSVPSSTAGIHLFAESYGGKYGPVFASYFQDQNALIANGSLPSNSTIPIRIETVGIVNGLIDDAIQDLYYPTFAYNNTYGIQAISQSDQLNTLAVASNDCLRAIDACRGAMNSTDPEGEGDQPYTNIFCKNAQYTCNQINAPYYLAGYNPYDIRQKLPSPDPPAAYQEYLNTASVLSAIGARVNYTESSKYVQQSFISTGDTIRGGQIDELASLLSLGVRVALIYGDADYVCNWYGGQAVSLAIAKRLSNYSGQQAAAAAGALQSSPTPYATGFPAAGYAEIVVNSSYVGGSVRQYGNLSFSRIYDAGHMVPYYQPETAFTVFTRIIYGTDISTGRQVNSSSYRSTGPANSTHTNSAPPSPSPTCWIRAVNATCNSKDISSMLQGKGMVAHGIFYQDDASVNLPKSTVLAGVPGQPTNSGTTSTSKGSGTPSTMALTGVYTATGTPSPSGGAARTLTRETGSSPLPLLCVMLGFVFGTVTLI